MAMALLLVHLSAARPLVRAWLANRNTTLLQAANAALVAWTGWLLVLLDSVLDGGNAAALRYVALCLTAAAGIAVLGARRPGVQAWNFVLAGLLAVLLLPLAESAVVRKPLLLEFPRAVLLAATLAMIVLNYLPTRLGAAALVLTAGSGTVLAGLAGAAVVGWLPAAQAGIALAPWLADLAWRVRPAPPSEFDRLWLDFRDRFGLFWAQRVREQFQRAAENASWPVVLRWPGLRTTQGANLEPLAEPVLATLRALLKRFGSEDVS